MNKDFPYEDILHCSPPVLPKHPPMKREDRAAQFAPFAALTGYDAAVAETARLTEKRQPLSEQQLEQLNQKLECLQEWPGDAPFVTVTEFVPDPLKSGGAYRQVSGILKEINGVKRLVVLQDGTEIEMEQIDEIDSPLFLRYEDA